MVRDQLVAWVAFAALAVLVAVAFHDLPRQMRAAADPTARSRSRTYHLANVASLVVLGTWSALAVVWSASDPVLPGVTVAFQWFGAGVAWLGAALGGWARLVLADAFVPTAWAVPDQRVVDEGPYAVVRHPFYAALVLVLIGLALALQSAWTLVTVVLVAGIVCVLAVEEERHLVAVVGPAYVAYQARVRRWGLF